MRRIITILALGAILTGVAEARMFQWTNPGSGKVQLSGTPPAWYRGTQPGPRVLVFENGELIDDTSVEVPEHQRIYLRDIAFGEHAAELNAEVADRGVDDLKAALDKAHEQGVDVAAVTEQYNQAPPPRSEPGDGENIEDIEDKVAALKSLIDVWDQQQLDQARSLLELLPDEPLNE